MIPPDPAPMPGAREARDLLVLSIGSAAFVIAVYLLQLFPTISAHTAFALPALLAIGLYLAIRLARAGTAAVPATLLIPGVIFIVGGAAFDIAATLHHTPDLRQEANPIARALLDSGYSLAAVYGLAVVCQGLYVSLICATWVALLKNRSFLVRSLGEARSPLAFLKAATGGAGLTCRQWFFPMRFSQFPDTRYAVWVLAVTLFASGAERWYLGFEWYGLVYGSRMPVVVCAILLGLCIYLTWLWRASRSIVTAQGRDFSPMSHRPDKASQQDRRGKAHETRGRARSRSSVPPSISVHATAISRLQSRSERLRISGVPRERA